MTTSTPTAPVAACDLYRMLHAAAPPGSAMEVPALAAYVEALEARVRELETTVADLIAAGSPLTKPEMCLVPRAMLERIIEADFEGNEYGAYFLAPLGHWQDIRGWAEEALR